LALIDRVETFCNEFIKTNNQRKAYRAAYPSSVKWKDATVDSKASVFAKTDKVLERLAELRKEMAEENQIDRTEILEQLKKIGFADIDLENIRTTDKIKALEIMARMLGFDRPEHEEDSAMLTKLIKGFNDL
jgi:phage terminase small subunit